MLTRLRVEQIRDELRGFSLNLEATFVKTWKVLHETFRLHRNSLRRPPCRRRLYVSTLKKLKQAFSRSLARVCSQHQRGFLVVCFQEGFSFRCAEIAKPPFDQP